MASPQILVFVLLVLLQFVFQSVVADLNEEALSKDIPRKSVVVEGMVYCQSCKKVGTSSISEAEPIPLAKVSVICTNYKNRKFYYKEYEADEDGYFYAKLEGFSMDHIFLDHPLTSCKVKLVSSPIESCDILTNINDGITGVSLRHEHKRLITKDCDTVFYAAGPLAFRPYECKADGSHY